jgi:hypothetical protein
LKFPYFEAAKIQKKVQRIEKEIIKEKKSLAQERG